MNELRDEIESEFEEFATKIDEIQQLARDKAEMLIRVELRAAKELFPDQDIEFVTAMYAPYIKVTPGIDGETKLSEFEIKDTSPKMQQLKVCVDRMTQIAIHLEDTYRHDLGFVTLGEDDLDDESELTGPKI